MKKEILRVALGEIQTQEARIGEGLSEEETEKILRKLIKSNQETIEASSDADVKDKLAREIEILSGMLPQTMSIAEIEAALADHKEAILGAPNDGAAIGMGVKALKSAGAVFDGSDAAQAIRAIRAS